jgi:predicted PurR-regulated permease PerM
MSRLTPDADDARFIRRVVILIMIAGVTAALFKAGDLLILAFGSMLGAIIIHAVKELYEERLKVPARLALVLGYLTVLAVMALLFWLFGVQFAPQINALVVRTPGLLDQLAHWTSQTPVGARIARAVQAAYADSRIAQDVGTLVRGSGEFLLNCLLLLVGALFFAGEPDIYKRGALLLVPKTQRPAFADTLDDVAHALRLWLRAQLIQMTTMGVLVGLGLWIADVPSPAALGLLTGLSEFIPYVGPTAAMLPALGLAATAGTGPLVGALITFAIVRLLQSNLITPFVTQRVVAIPPAITLFAIIGIGMVFGLFGLFFSAALLVAIFTVIRSLYLREVLGEDVESKR